MIGIVTNLGKPRTLEAQNRLTDILERRGILYRTYTEASEISGCGDDLECVITVGGDGSLLRAATHAVERDIPVFGINLGRVGFLTEVKEDRMEDAVDRYLRHEYTEERRMMLHCRLNGETVNHALNDVLVSKSSFSGLTEMNVSVDRDRVGTVFCDGMLTATPTGSTGYTLSAGGPVLYADLDAIVVTPVCSHSVYIRPFVVKPESVISFEMRDSGFVCIDGTQAADLHAGDIVSVTKSDRTFRLIRFDHTNIAGLIREKLC